MNLLIVLLAAMKYATLLYAVLPVTSLLAFGFFCYYSKFYGIQHFENTYRAAVVEYHPTGDANLTAFERLNANVDEYVEILNDMTKDVDIVVFPESTLQYGGRPIHSLLEFTTMVPSSQDQIIPCKEYDYELFFRKLSCASKTYKLYLSVDLLERYNCEDEGSECKIFNTNVVFNREGRVIARYRKFHLHGESGINHPEKPEIATFETDFGVTFGVFICFDILNEKPSMDLISGGTKHFIFPNMWYSELPFLTSLQVQNMWSYEHDVVLLAAGANNPFAASGGSGIYQGRQGPLKAHFNGVEMTKVLIASVQKTWDSSERLPKRKDNSWDYFTFWKNNFTGYTTEIVPDQSLIERTLCSGENFCCHFVIIQKVESFDPIFRIFAYQGYRTFGGTIRAGIEICALVSCKTKDINTCGESFREANNLLYYASVSATTTETNNYYPNSLTTDYIPLGVQNFKWSQLPNKTKIELMQQHGGILSFGIFGRFYD